MRPNEESLSAQAEAAIREGIVKGQFPFGARLSDRQLADVLGFSRTPVREALTRLANEDLVVVRPQSGTFVVSFDGAAIKAVCEMRAMLECGALRLVSRDPSRLAAGVSIHLATGMLAIEEGDLEKAYAMDEAFHNSLISMADNPLLSRTYRSISDQVSALRHRLPRDAVRIQKAMEHHRRIIDLAITGRMVEAETELTNYIGVVQSVITALLVDGPASRNGSR